MNAVTHDSHTTVVNPVTFASHQIEDVPRGHDIFFCHRFPDGHNCERAGTLFNLIVQKNTAVSGAYFFDDVALQVRLHPFNHVGGHTCRSDAVLENVSQERWHHILDILERPIDKTKNMRTTRDV